METLFSPEVIERFLEILSKATEGGVTAIVVYLLLPAIMLLISAAAWFAGTFYTVRAIRDCVLHWRERPIVNEVKLDVNKFLITSDTTPELMKEFLTAISERERRYIHEQDVSWAMQALKNQKVIDDKKGGGRYRPAKIEAEDLV